ncbi:hypothetical protein SK128_025994 [Halocaridina rubra]|uniref:Uncharacterized protein n=1 Tax=Halocaridina rubra TaxID=373956 RepID=A0AAN9A656_HALRR
MFGSSRGKEVWTFLEAQEGKKYVLSLSYASFQKFLEAQEGKNHIVVWLFVEELRTRMTGAERLELVITDN